VPALANSPLEKPKVNTSAVISIAASTSASKDAVEQKHPPRSPGVKLRIAVDDAGACVTLTCTDGQEPSSARSIASRDEPDSDYESAASALTSPARQGPGSCESSAAASPRPEACVATSSGDMAASSAAAGHAHELLPVLLTPLRLKGDYCNVAVLNASEATLALMRKIEAGADEVVVDDSEVIKILNGHIGRPVSGVCSALQYAHSCMQELLLSPMYCTHLL
jgi:hypothetical protein